jgi:hypothetical protein
MFMSSGTLSTQELPLETWVAEQGDQFLVDTKENIGYLIHSDGTYAKTDVLTGQRRIVRYIGRTYDATTPIGRWDVQSTHIKGDRTTFGPRGLFLRMYKDNEQTPYGIHGHRTFATMLAEGDRFRSMGCILVPEDVLTLLEQTYILNSEHLGIATVYGLEEYAVPEQSPLLANVRPSWLP